MVTHSQVCKTVLPNGVRILSETVPYVDSVSVGVWACAGSRDETARTQGISHFVEHMLFKGTENRSARQIADEVEGLGGHLNAFTDKEFTCYYSKVLAEHLPSAMDILFDMILNSVFDPTEIEREKNVVIEEIKRHRDTPEEQVHDLLAETIWKGHRLGNPVIGSVSAVKKLTREDLVGYLKRFYGPHSLVISAAGKVDHRQFVDIVASAVGDLMGKSEPRSDEEPVARFESKLIEQQTEQVHFCLGTAGYSQNRREKYALAAVDMVLGGGMSSRLFQEIRETRGLAYSIGSYAASYREGGLFVVYGGASVENIGTVLELIEAECDKIANHSITDAELARSKNQIRGALVMGQESMSNRMNRLAKSEIYFGRIIRLEEIIASIMQVSKDDVAEVASQLFSDAGFALAAIGPFKENANLLIGSLLAR